MQAKRNSDCTGFVMTFNFVDDGDADSIKETEMGFGPDEWAELLSPITHINAVQRLTGREVSSVLIAATYRNSRKSF